MFEKRKFKELTISQLEDKLALTYLRGEIDGIRKSLKDLSLRVTDPTSSVR